MKRTSALFVIVLFANIAFAQTSAPISDTRQQEKVIENWNQGWLKKDAKLAAQAYTDDADWTKAFGMKKKGAGRD